MAPDFYAILGVTPQADAAQIKAAFRQLARALHPDSAAAIPAAPDRLAQVLAAWHVLQDPTRRAAYDRARAHPTPQVAARPGQDPLEHPGGGPDRDDAVLVAGPTIIHPWHAPAPGPHIRVGPPIRLDD